MSTYSVVVLTAPPTGSTEAGGAFVKVDGREALLKSVELFLNRDNIKQIQLVVNPEGIEEAKRKFGGHLGFSGVKLVSGGPKWIDQIVAASNTISAEATHIILHDAARPAVAYSDIDALLETAAKNPAVALVSPLKSPVIETDEGGGVIAVHPPGRFSQMLTPMAFSKATFDEMAKSKTELHASKFTTLVGLPMNVRVNTNADAGMVKTMISMLPKPKVKPLNSPFEEAQW